jgi:hypothetical protein
MVVVFAEPRFERFDPRILHLDLGHQLRNQRSERADLRLHLDAHTIANLG